MPDRAALRSAAPAVGLFLFAGAVYLASLPSARGSIDVVAAALQAWQLASTGSLTLDQVPYPSDQAFTEVDGGLVANRFPGAVLVGVPLYAVWPAQAFSLVPASATAALLTAAAAAVLFLALRGLVREPLALVAAGLFAFGTSAWAVAADALWPHTPALLALAVAMHGARRERWVATGLALGGAVLCRPHLGVVCVVFVLWLLPRWRPAMTVAAGTAAGTGAFLVYNRLLYGSWTVLGSYSDQGRLGSGGYGVGPLAYNVAGALVSPMRGVLVYTPALLVLLPGIVRAWRIAPGWVRCSALAGVAYSLLQLSLNRFSGGTVFYGYRLTLEMLVLSVPLLVLSWQAWTSRTAARCRAFVVLSVMSLGTQVLLGVAPPPVLPHTPWTRNDVVDVLGPGAALVCLLAAAALWSLLWVRDSRRARAAAPAAANSTDGQPRR